MSTERKKLRCAIYTRKSTEEGLEQEFNTLDAQRQACEAYILSQAGEGWEALDDRFDDGGWSGGNIDRPAMAELLEKIRQGRVDVVVVYKVDRLTRSLMDFARIVETFDKHEVSFVSVTQAFNTTNSMGRLTLNVLLSFAQFEREVTSERIRDKIAASKKRGMWMGGNLPLGYDLGERRLVVNASEAEQVRYIFERYLDLGSIVKLAKELERNGICSKRWISRRGREHGGCALSPGAVAHILGNPIYIGKIRHTGQLYSGDHEGIIDHGQYDRVQEMLASHRVEKRKRRSRAPVSPLTGKISDTDGQPMRPTFGYGRGKKIYRYYASESRITGGNAIEANMRGLRISAERTERLILDRLRPLLAHDDDPKLIFDAIETVVAVTDRLEVRLCRNQLPTRSEDEFTRLVTVVDEEARTSDGMVTISLDARPTRRGRTILAKAHLLDDAETATALVELVKSSHRKLEELNASPLQPMGCDQLKSPGNEFSRRRVIAGLLAPDIQKALVTGKVPAGLDPERLLSPNMPLDWKEQRQFLGMK